MAKAIHKLTAKKIESLTKPGWHSDGGGLYLRVRPDGSKRWIYLWMREGKRREMFLGTNPEFTVEQIRGMAASARELIAKGNDPLELRQAAAIEAKEAEEAAAAGAEAQLEENDATPTFGKFAEEYISTHEEGWKNEKHRWQWRNSITNHCKLIVEKRVNEITTDDVLDVLRPIWTTIPDTAGRVRGRIETILDAAKAGNHIESPWENPARWKGNLIHRLPKRKKLSTGHYTAIAYEEMPEFFKALGTRPAPAARALELTILCATRTSETLKMRWREVDFQRATWVIPKERMKMGVEHRIPLSTDALVLLKKLASESSRDPEAFVFPGQKKGKPLSQMSMTMVMRRMNLGHYTVHGMRSSFRDYMGDMTHHAETVVEQALAHQVGDATIRAYPPTASHRASEGRAFQ